jgi:hypothetical protein
MSVSYVNKDKADHTSRMRYLTFILGTAITQEDSRWLPIAAAPVRAQVRICGICGGQSSIGADFLRVLPFPYQSSHRLLHIHRYQSTGAGKISQIVTDVPSGPSFTPPKEI